MRPLLYVAAAALILAGVLALAYQQISFSRSETVLQVGSVRATREVRRTLPLSPLVGVGAIAGGVVLLVMARKR